MDTAEAFTKRRFIWQVNALQLLREKKCADYARQAIPATVDGVKLLFPRIKITLGFRVTVRSYKLSGEALFSMLYNEETKETALKMGLTVLKALHTADLTTFPVGLFNNLYQRTRWPKLLLSELTGSPLLTAEQKKRLRRLVSDYMANHNGQEILLHGDLQASHLIWNPAEKSLGLIDLEAMRMGKPVTNFAQLWQDYYSADPLLGRRFFQQYLEQFPDLWNAQFDQDARAEIALRSYRKAEVGQQTGNREMERMARALLASSLSGATFTEICREGSLHGN